MSEIPPYNEEYWDDALNTLKREERKQSVKRAVPFILLFVVIGILSVVIESSVDTKAKWGFILEDEGINISKQSITENVGEGAIVRPNEKSSTQNKKANAQKRNNEASLINSSALKQSKEHKSGSIQLAKSDKDEIGLKENRNSGVKSKSIDDTPENINYKEGSQEEFKSLLYKPGSSQLVERYNMNYMILRNIPQNVIGGVPVKRIGDTRFRPNHLAPRSNQFFVSLGSSLFTGYGSNSNDLRFNPEITAGYAYVLNPSWELRAAVCYYEIGGIRHSVDIEQVELGFGSVTNRTTIFTEKLSYASIPVQLNYLIDIRHSIGLNLTGSYLLNTSNLVKTGVVGANTETSEERGYVEGYNALTYAVGASYSFRLNNNWIFGLDYQYGLSNVIDGAVYESTGNDRSSRTVIRMNYKLK